MSFEHPVLISASATFILGLPLALELRWAGLLTGVILCVASTMIGALAMCAFLGFRDASLGAGCGLAGGVLFCLVAGIPWWPRRS